MGGYAALLFAALCDFDGAIATAPQTSLLSAQRLALKDDRWALKIPETRAATGTPGYLDLTGVLTANPTPRYQVFHGTADRLDRLHAIHVAALPGVEVEEVEAPDHNVARALRDSGTLDRLLASIKA